MSYTHACGIDRPLAIWKSNVGTIVTHQNWRGQFARGTFGVGTRAGQSSDCESYPPSNGCIPVPWPGWNTTAWHEGVGSQSTTGSEHYWMGSLASEMRDASGQMYMRNRYYDPQTGQFTQMDPIGLAGGLNSYGFAAGDPVSYSDPYGLCPRVARLAPAMAADGPVPAVDAALAVACLAELGVIGFRWYRTARVAESALSQDAARGETEPTLPDRVIVSEGDVTIEHYYRGDEHGPAHMHVNGGGGSTRIGPNGHPLRGDPELTRVQARVVNDHISEIRRAGNKIGRWLQHKERTGQ